MPRIALFIASPSGEILKAAHQLLPVTFCKGDSAVSLACILSMAAVICVCVLPWNVRAALNGHLVQQKFPGGHCVLGTGVNTVMLILLSSRFVHSDNIDVSCWKSHNLAFSFVCITICWEDHFSESCIHSTECHTWIVLFQLHVARPLPGIIHSQFSLLWCWISTVPCWMRVWLVNFCFSLDSTTRRVEQCGGGVQQQICMICHSCRTQAFATLTLLEELLSEMFDFWHRQ